MMKNWTGMWYLEWQNILFLLSVQCIHLVWWAQCAWLKRQKKLNTYKLYYIYTSTSHLYWLYEVSASDWNLLVCSSSQVFLPWNKWPDNLCGTSIDVPPSCRKRFLQGANITYFHFKHSNITITLFILFIFYVWHERHEIIWVNYNSCLFEVFTKCLLCQPKRVQ